MTPTIIVLFLACTQPDDRATCEVVRQPWDGDIMSCAMGGEISVTRWLSEHPGLTLLEETGWTCKPADAPA
jgi:hypothetical protein